MSRDNTVVWVGLAFLIATGVAVGLAIARPWETPAINAGGMESRQLLPSSTPTPLATLFETASTILLSPETGNPPPERDTTSPNIPGPTAGPTTARTARPGSSTRRPATTRKPTRPGGLPPSRGTWTWEVDRASDLNLRSGPYVYTIGAGGGLYSLLGRRGQPLQAPPFKGELFDRVVAQHVLWAIGTVAKPIGTMTNDDRRWNQNQMGGWEGPGFRTPIYPKVTGLELDAQTYILRAYSKTNEQFQPLLRTYFQTNIASLVRYSPLSNSVLLIERFVLLGRSTEEGRPLANLNDLYMEQWCTFRNSEFTSVAFELSADGAPTRVSPAAGLASYPGTPAGQTTGYAVAYGGSEVLALMWNRGRPNVWNSRSYNGLFALLPASDFDGPWREGSIVVQSMAVAVAPTLREMAAIVRYGQRLVPETRMLAPGATSVPGLAADELAKLRATLTQDGPRTVKMGQILKLR